MTLLVGSDARCLNTSFMRGMGEFVGPLVSHMSSAYDIAWKLYGHRPDLPFHMPPDAGHADAIARDVRGDRFQTWEQVFLPWRSLRDRLDVLHCTSTTLPWWQPVPTVVTIHDTIPWDTGETIPPGFFRDRLLPAALRKCAAVVTISEHSKGDILRLWPDLAPKTTVIRHGLNHRYFRPVPPGLTPALRAEGIGAPFLLYFGGPAERKRLAWTLDLFQALDRTDIELVVCGVHPTMHERFRQMLPPAVRPRVIFAPFLDAEDMPSLYQAALVVLYPTLYEGFGVPALNAQAVGTPIAFSDVSSLRELVGPTSAALDPEDRAGWIATVNRLVDRRLADPTPDAASIAWARQFDWHHAAAAYWALFQSVAKKGRNAG